MEKGQATRHISPTAIEKSPAIAGFFTIATIDPM
jgi:hypothetical protein